VKEAIMASKKKTDKSEDETIENQEGAEPADENAETGQKSETLAEDSAETSAEEADMVTGSPVTDLHARLTKAVHAISTQGGQEKVFALHQLELLTGRLKMVLPAGIAATEDAELRTGLNAILAIL
jgi:hypothetical protein